MKMKTDIGHLFILSLTDICHHLRKSNMAVRILMPTIISSGAVNIHDNIHNINQIHARTRSLTLTPEHICVFGEMVGEKCEGTQQSVVHGILSSDIKRLTGAWRGVMVSTAG